MNERENRVTQEQVLLTEELIKASEAYYNEGNSPLSDFEFDKKLKQLEELEKDSGTVLPDSPTTHVGAKPTGSKLSRVQHKTPMKSLSKTQDQEEYISVFERGARSALLQGFNSITGAVVSYKEDGMTGVATFEGGKLKSLVTRGDGEAGFDVTHNAKYIKGLPSETGRTDDIVVRGEVVMSYNEFNRINAEMSEDEEHYKNPRNLANSTLQNEMLGRELHFLAFEWVSSSDAMPDSYSEQLDELGTMGFEVVPHLNVGIGGIKAAMDKLTDRVKDYEYPVDGLVTRLNNTLYAATLSDGDKYPNPMKGMAFKWQDTPAMTILRDIEWSPSRTGVLTPVAVFDPVELEGTTVTRCTLHNVSNVLKFNLHIGDKVDIVKHNMIIPGLVKNHDANIHEQLEIDSIHGIKTCPCCKSRTFYHVSKVEGSDTITCYCPNEKCPSKKIGAFVHMCENDCLNIVGLSEETITTFVEHGFVKDFADFWHLDRHKKEIIALDRFGAKKFDNIVAAVEAARKCTFVGFVHALGLNNIGKGQAKVIGKYIVENYERLSDGIDKANPTIWDVFMEMLLTDFDFSVIDGIGEVRNEALYSSWVYDDLQLGEPTSSLPRLLAEVEFTDIIEATPSVSALPLAGLTFVITGDVYRYKNRAALQEEIERLGGKASGSVSAKTSYLINNDVTSTSSKNKKAHELGIPIISEEQYIKLKDGGNID